MTPFKLEMLWTFAAFGACVLFIAVWIGVTLYVTRRRQPRVPYAYWVESGQYVVCGGLDLGGKDEQA